MPGARDRGTRAPRAAAGASDIRAVAKRAGVSISTISRFLNGKKRLSDATEQRIRAAVQETGYAPNSVARSLRLKRTNTLGLLLPDSSNPFFSGLVRGADDAARAAGFTLMLFNSSEDPARERENVAALQSLRCDGALVIGTPGGPDEKERAATIERSSMPLVCVDRDYGWAIDTVVADNAGGGYEAGAHLLKLGHRRIGIISADYEVSTHRDRRAGCHRAMAQGRLTPRREYEMRAPLTMQDGFAAAARLLAMSDPPTALFATSNALTIGAVAAVRAQGLRCPTDVSVVGYDSYDWQEVFEPRLTTVKQPAYLMGQRAAELLIERINGGRTGAPERVVLPSTLVVRESSAAPGR